MNRSVSNALLNAAVAILASASYACDSSTKGTTSNPDAGSPVDASMSSDVGPYGACTTKPVTDPAPDLTGRWAIRTVASRYVPATGLTSAFYTRTVSVLLADNTQSGTDVTLSAQYCSQKAEDPDSPAHVVIPDSYVSSLKPFVRSGKYAADSTGVAVLQLPSFIEVQGAELAAPSSDLLPTDADDATVVDQDKDGNPGITIKLSGLASGDLYVVQRQTSTWTGIAVGADRVEGRYAFKSEQNVLAANPTALKSLAAQTAVADPSACASSFVMVRVGATATCAEVLADTSILD